MSLPAFNGKEMTIWAIELPNGQRYDITRYNGLDKWAIDEVFYNQAIEDWDAKEVYDGSDPGPVFEIMKKCGVKFLTN